MKVEIWSDVMCPFCYIGKRRFERALEQAGLQDGVVVEWKSFQLNAHMKTEPGKTINQYLAEVKGWSAEQAAQANEHVTQMAASEGLHYRLDRAVVANSRKAHRLIQFAKTKGLGDIMEEALFSAYFTEGRNTDDRDTLIELASQAGLDSSESTAVLDENSFDDAVERDLHQARQVGVRGVPYFVFDNKYAVSGAQSADTFREVLTRSWNEWSGRTHIS